MKVLRILFEEGIEKPISIDTGDSASEDSVMSLRSIESIGRAESVQQVCEKVLEDETVSIHETI